MRMTQSQEDYLEMVGFLSEKNGQARVTDIAAELGFSKPSVLTALKILEEKALIQHERYGAVLLTEKGRSLAGEIQEKHRLITKFLHEIIGVSPEIAEKDACRMEHVLSDETVTKLRAFMSPGRKR
jgi:DtxR family Mn-dependent transcriptional regulator